jgi:predicted TIM-barrel fold metal-dependent hydrolase
MDPQVRDFVESLTRRLAEAGAGMTIDGDTHATDLAALSEAQRSRYESSDDYYHGRPVSAEDLVREMDLAGVNAALVWQNPAATEYTADPGVNTQRLLAANRYILDSAMRFPGRFIPGGWTDPRACGMEGALRIAETCLLEFGFLFVKLNPAQNQYPIDSAEVLAVVDRIVELGGIPAFHFGADTPFTPAEGLERVATRHPGHPLLAIHMGGGGASYLEAEGHYQKARRLGLARPNIRFSMSARRDTHTESDLIAYEMAGEPYCRNLFCASDAPYGRIAWNFGGFRCIFDTLMKGERHTDRRVRAVPGLFTPEAARRYLGGNLARFVVEGYAHKAGEA